ncbi:hypothetical protein P167DRAFT_575866 [Morchella conica CCBAS932]|uniref:Uncharacterized protein n=1 Tax=Morchella conica CCBAS932 TaxID=1392247 RepID=A0A3N4KMV2_9PEZI|nr:hypothetical protein P167DRAFT_575866 [Morchella conica CCBAS932]
MAHMINRVPEKPAPEEVTGESQHSLCCIGKRIVEEDKFFSGLQWFGRFGKDNNPTGLVFLHSDLLALNYVLRQPMEVLVEPAEDTSSPGAIFESISVAIYNVVCRALRLPCCRLGHVDNRLGLDLREADDYKVLNGKILKEINWRLGSTSDSHPLVWVAAKIIYVIMLNVTEETMIEMGKQWFD